MWCVLRCRELGTGLAECLSGLGMLDSPEGRALLVAASSSIVDSLPKAGEACYSSTCSALLTAHFLLNRLLRACTCVRLQQWHGA